MSKLEKEIQFFKDDKESVICMRFNPAFFSLQTLTRIAASQFGDPKDRRCVIVSATKRTIVSSDYLQEVEQLDPSLRKLHILETANIMRKAKEVFIQKRQAVDKV